VIPIMNRYHFALTLLTGLLTAGGACAQSYSFAVINDGLQPTTIRRPYAINDKGVILLQPYSAFNTSTTCLLIKGTTITQTQQYSGSDQYYSLSNNGFITGSGINGTYYLDDVQYNLNPITVPKGDTCTATGINSSQLVVGMATSPTDGTYGWTWSNKTFKKYAYPKSTGCTLTGVNDNGDFVGTYYVGNTHKLYYPFMVVKGKPLEIVVPGYVDATPTAISGTEIVVGTALSNSANRMVGFVRSKAGKVEIIDYKSHAPATIQGPSGPAKLSSAYGTEVFGVNASGVIVGTFTGTYVSSDGKWAQTEYIPFIGTPK